MRSELDIQKAIAAREAYAEGWYLLQPWPIRAFLWLAEAMMNLIDRVLP